MKILSSSYSSIPAHDKPQVVLGTQLCKKEYKKWFNAVCEYYPFEVDGIHFFGFLTSLHIQDAQNIQDAILAELTFERVEKISSPGSSIFILEEY